MAGKRRKKLGIGRPPLKEHEKLKATVLIRLLPDEAEQLRRLASNQETGVGQYARDVIRRHLRRTAQ